MPPPTRPGHRALRTGRVSLPNHAYHVTFTTRDRRPHFHDLTRARPVARALHDAAVTRDATTLAWCLMPDHLHWLLQLGETIDLAQLVQRLKSLTTKALHQHGAGGAIWAPGYFDHALRRDEDLRIVARYIVANPIRAGLAATVGDYPHWNVAWDLDPAL